MARRLNELWLFVLGFVALLWVCLSLASLAQFLVDAVLRFGVVPVGGVLVCTFAAYLLVTNHFRDDDAPLWTGLVAGARSLAERTGFVSPAVLVRGAVSNDEWVWVFEYRSDGETESRYRVCPHCGVELDERHLPQSELPERARADGAAEVNTRRRAGELYVDTLACPRCIYAFPGAKDDNDGVEGARNAFVDVVDTMRTNSDAPFEPYRREAKRRLGVDPTPDDVWDQFVRDTEPEGAVPRNELTDDALDGADRESARRPVDTYTAFEKLKQKRNRWDRLVDLLPEPVDRFAAVASRSNYLERKAEVKARRQSVATEFARQYAAFEDDSLWTLSSLADARRFRRLPDADRDETRERLASAEEHLSSLGEFVEAESEFVTGGERRSVLTAKSQLTDARSYFERVTALTDPLDVAGNRLDAFDERVASVRDHDTYLDEETKGTMREALTAAQRRTETARETLEAVDERSDPVPEEVRTRLDGLEDRLDASWEWLFGYDDRFLEAQRETYPDVFETEHGPLNPEQAWCVVVDEPNNLVDASAGTGKTMTLTKRFQYLVERGHSVDDIAAITFTGDAADEMCGRVTEALGVDEDRLHVSTAHSLARDIVERAMVGNFDGDESYEERRKALVRRFVEFDDDLRAEHPDAVDSFRDHLGRAKSSDPAYVEEETRQDEDEIEFFVRRFDSFVETARGFDRDADDVRAATDRSDTFEYHFARAGAAILDAVEERAADIEPVDHADELATATALVEEYPERYADRFDHVLVDEFQDVSETVLGFVQALVSGDTHLFAVGDDWQSIFGFNGSRPEFFRTFEDRFDGTSKTTLKTNYRCPPAILDASVALMENSDEATSKEVSADSDLRTTPRLHRLNGVYYGRVGEYVAELVSDALADGADPSDVMVLNRTKTDRSPLPQVRLALADRSIPFDDDDDGDSHPDGVALRSIHAAKGTEAEHVILVHAVDDDPDGLPSTDKTSRGDAPAMDTTANYYEEERRLCYVALTRAEAELDVVADSERVSRYLRELEDHFEVVDTHTAFEGVVSSVEREKENQPYVVELDCGGTTVKISAWESRLPDEVVEGATLRFEGLDAKLDKYPEHYEFGWDASVEVAARAE